MMKFSKNIKLVFSLLFTSFFYAPFAQANACLESDLSKVAAKKVNNIISVRSPNKIKEAYITFADSVANDVAVVSSSEDWEVVLYESLVEGSVRDEASYVCSYLVFVSAYNQKGSGGDSKTFAVLVSLDEKGELATDSTGYEDTAFDLYTVKAQE